MIDCLSRAEVESTIDSDLIRFRSYREGEKAMTKDGQSRRELLKKMVYVAPLVLTLPAARAQDQPASGERAHNFDPEQPCCPS